MNYVTYCFLQQSLGYIQHESKKLESLKHKLKKLERTAKMTEIEQEHAQLIDLNLERLNKLEKELDDLKETLLCVMNMMTAYFESRNIKFEEINDD